jgi:hypothetical protein
MKRSAGSHDEEERKRPERLGMAKPEDEHSNTATNALHLIYVPLLWDS